MREIKFRAWRKSANRLFSWPSLVAYLAMCQDDIAHIFEGEGDGDLVLMQYTGLKDKNGVEIYEGDIVRCKGEDEDDVATCIVEYHDGEFTRRYPESSTNNWDGITSRGLAPHLIREMGWAVIGNIYENPELIGKE